MKRPSLTSDTEMNLTHDAEQYVGQQNSPNTRDAYRRDLGLWFSQRLPLGVESVVRFKRMLIERFAPSTAKRTYATVSAYHDWLRRQGKLPINPFEAVKPPQMATNVAPNVPTDEQVSQVLAAIDRRSLSGMRHYAILCLLLNGLRAQEVCDLRVGDIFAEPVVARVVGKGRKERMVPLTVEAITAVDEYTSTLAHHLRRPRDDGDWLIEDVFPGVKITRHQVAYVCRKYGELAGVGGFTPHSFRHHYGTRLYRATHDVLGVGKLMGHSKPETTQVYARMDLDDLIATAKQDPRYGRYDGVALEIGEEE